MPKAARNFSDASRRRSTAPPPADADLPPAVEFLPPMKPSRRMFLLGAFLVAAWIGTLLTLYFTTIYPNRAAGKNQHAPAGTTSESPATLPAGTVAR